LLGHGRSNVPRGSGESGRSSKHSRQLGVSHNNRESSADLLLSVYYRHRFGSVGSKLYQNRTKCPVSCGAVGMNSDIFTMADELPTVIPL